MLPQSNIDLSRGVVFQDQPSLTWIADPVTNRLRGRGDNWEAVRQAVEVIVNVERFKWQIYTPNFGIDYEGLLGNEPGFVASELQRRLVDAFLPDNRILGILDKQEATLISDGSYNANADMAFSYDGQTIYIPISSTAAWGRTCQIQWNSRSFA